MPSIDSEAPVATDANIVSLSDVRFWWRGRQNFNLRIRSFRVLRGEKLLLIGPSGSGKSTFLSLIAGIVSPSVGTIEVLGTNLSRLSSNARDRFRAEHMGVIFQMFNLLPYATVLDNVLLPLNFAPQRRMKVTNGAGLEREAARLLRALGLEEYCGQAASSLSVGQQQRAAAARALIGRPEIIIADEPTSALDRGRQEAFLNLLFGEAEVAGSTLVMVSHDESLGQRFDRVQHLDEIAITGERD